MPSNEVIERYRQNIAGLNSVFVSLHVTIRQEKNADVKDELYKKVELVLDEIETLTRKLEILVDKTLS